MFISQCHHLHGKDGCVLCTVHTHRSHGNTRRHLDDAEHSIKPVKHSLDGHPNHGQGGRCGNHTGQGGSHAGSGNDYLDASLLGSAGESLHGIGSAVGRECVHFKGYLHLIEKLAGFFHNRQVTGAAHDNAY